MASLFITDGFCGYKKKLILLVAMNENLFSAAIFDYDGTLTERSYSSVPPAELQYIFQQFSGKIPLAICSARILPQMLEKLELLLGDRYLELRKYWTLFVENGGAGYRFDGSDFVEFYRVQWPENIFPRKKFDQLVNNFFSPKVDHISMNQSCYIFRPFGWNKLNSQELLRQCNELEKEAHKFFVQSGGDQFLQLGNSSMGIIFCLKDGDKDRGVQEFGKLFGMRPPYREIVVVGDRPADFGNDRVFLNGKLATPFSVGEMVSGSIYPSPVLDENSKRLIGPLATAFLLKKLEFRGTTGNIVR